MRGSLIFKQADAPAEFEQIHRLNYRTFAEEVGQYTPDGFHDRNTYHVAIHDGRVIGMVAAQDRPPFSIESRLEDPSVLASLGGPLLEVRLLSVEPDCRHRLVLPGLLLELYRYARERRYSHLIISGITSKLNMYQRIGFRPLGQAVESGAASFVPMAMPLAQPARYAAPFIKRQRHANYRPLISLMPGPVEIAPSIRRAFLRPPVSHRSPEFVAAYERVRATLARLAGGMRVAIMTGSGTTANDAVGLHLREAFLDAPGIVLINGEFGERIARQATRAGLKFESLRWHWGRPWDFIQIAAALDRGAAWVWAVHLETSVGVLNRLSDLLALASVRGIPVAADCVSSIGTVTLPQGLWMATGVSGKAIAAYAGLSFVFASLEALDQVTGGDFPASLDVRAAATCVGPQFTVPSSLLFALDAGLTNVAANRFAERENKGRVVRSHLRRIGIQPLAAEGDAAPCVTTFAIPHRDFLDQCRARGFELGAGGNYLRDRGWAQIATMGDVDSEDIDRLFRGLTQ